MKKLIHICAILLFSFNAQAFIDPGETGVFTISLQSGFFLCADKTDSRAAGIVIKRKFNPATKEHLWLLKKIGANTYTIRNIASGKYLALPFYNPERNINTPVLLDNNADALKAKWIINTNTYIAGKWYISNYSYSPQGNIKVKLAAGETAQENGKLMYSTRPAMAGGEYADFIIGRIGNGDEVNAESWLTNLRALLNTARVRINNFTSTQNQYNSTGERAFYKPDDCFFTMTYDGREYTNRFLVDMIPMGPDNMCKMYVNDWNTSRISIAARNNLITLVLNFEDEGKEIQSNCYNNLNCHIGCPTYDFTNTKIKVAITPALRDGRLTYSATTEFSTQSSETGPCVNNFWAFLCPSNREFILRSTLENTLNVYLNGGSLKGVVELVLNSNVAVPAGTTQVMITSRGDIILF